jgi:hypothetical protein
MEFNQVLRPGFRALIVVDGVHDRRREYYDGIWIIR